MRVRKGVVYVNLTEVAKAFPDKNLTHIINSQEISDYCEKFSKLQNCSLADLLIITRGGNAPGTWAHQRVALRVAQKLSTEFSIWVDERIEELLTTGHSSLQHQYPVPQSYGEALMLAAQQQLQIEARGDNGIESGERRATEAKRVHPCYLAKQANSTGHPDSARLRDERKKVQRLTS